jgi:ATP-binding cassette subfamily B protein
MTSFPTTLSGLFREYLSRQKLGMAILMLFPTAIVLESTVMPYALRMIVNTLQTADAADADVWARLSPAMVLYIGAQGAMFLLFRIQDWVSTRVKPRLLAEMRLDAFAHAQRHSHRFFTDHFAGSLANKVADIPRAFSTLLDNINWRFTPALSVTSSVLITVAILHWQAAALLLVWTLIHLRIAWCFARPINAQSQENAEHRSALQGLMVDSFTNQLAARLFARFAQERAVLSEAQAKECRSFQQMMRTMFRMRFCLDLPMLVAVILLLFLCVWLWQAQALLVGDIVFILYAAMNVMTWVWMFATELPQFYADSGVIRQALDTLRAPLDVHDTPGAEVLRVDGGAITFEQVRFGYREPGGVFDGLSVSIAPGERVGLVGFSGSGKTTFINLLLRLYDVQGGRILIDGQDIAQVTQDSLHEAIAVIPQDTSLFHRSLCDNIRYGRPEATMEEVIAAARQAECHEFITGLEQGYETEVGERGVKLSGGQRQRIALARVILKNAPILVMDEATSALDSVTERVIQQAMETLMQGRTAIVIAHRLSTLAHLDRILVFNQGRLVEQGSHDTLLAAGGHYAHLWRMQAGGFLPEVA